MEVKLVLPIHNFIDRTIVIEENCNVILSHYKILEGVINALINGEVPGEITKDMIDSGVMDSFSCDLDDRLRISRVIEEFIMETSLDLDRRITETLSIIGFTNDGFIVDYRLDTYLNYIHISYRVNKDERRISSY